RFAQGELGGVVGARQRRTDRLVDAHVVQALAQQARLLFAHGRQGDVLLSLVAAFGVPRRFAMAGKQDSHAAGGSGTVGGTPATPRGAPTSLSDATRALADACRRKLS